MTADKACPECNTPISQSTHGDLLRYADPRWLERLRLAMSVKLWNVVFLVLFTTFAGILAGLGFSGRLLTLLGTLGGLLGLWAAFLITAQEPRIALAEDQLTLRKVVRGCAILGFAGSCMQETAPLIDSPWFLGLVGTLLGVTSIVSYFGEFIYLRRFARRMPDEQLAKSTTTVMWGMVVTLLCFGGVALVASIVGGMATGSGIPGAAAAGMAIAGCGAVVALLVFGVWYVRLLYRYRNAFAAAAAESRAGAGGTARPWRSEAGPPRYT